MAITTFLRPLILAGTMLAATNSFAQKNIELIITHDDGEKAEIVMPENAVIDLPLKGKDAQTGKTVTFKAKNVNHIDLKSGEASDGCTRWDVEAVATPSVMLGKRNTELRLLGVIAQDKQTGAKIYKWTVKSKQANGMRSNPWYGIMLKDTEVVYPFIQDGKVWLRDMVFTYKDTNPEFMNAINEYYVNGKKSITETRQTELKKNPTSILEHIK